MEKYVIVDNHSEIVDNEGTATGRALRADLAVEHIRKLIASAQLGPGDRVKEAEIAKQLNISRAPVREAIRRLESSGLVVSEPNFGSRVVQIDPPKIQALYEVREAIESMAAGFAAERMTDQERKQLLEMLNEHSRSMQKQGSSSYPAGSTDWDFHLAILKGARNDIAWRICGNDFRDLFSVLRAQHGRSSGRGERALLEHRWVADAINSGNSDFAKTLMAQHIRASRTNLLDMISVGEGNKTKEDNR